MVNLYLPKYDKCRGWINDAREEKIGWDKIFLALKKDRVELVEFLSFQKINSFWPDELDPEMWEKLVASQKEAEEKSIEVEQKSDKAELIDDSQDNEVSVPKNKLSSWQLYKNHLLDTGFNTISVDEIENATVQLLKRLSSNTTETGPVKGLVIGHVQSGKTANMAALMAMAADWGWNLFIVLSGTIENLRKQTQTRLLRDLNRAGNIYWSGLEHLSKDCPLEHRSQELRLEQESNVRYFTVCLKNPGRLKNLLEWMQQDKNKIRQMKVIVIDDEADQASINTQNIESKVRTSINNLIVNLVEGNKPNGDECKAKALAMNYISYTATPYANFLNESTPESLYPKNFIRSLSPSNEYFGPKQIFGIEETDDCDGINVIRVIDKNDLAKIKSIHKSETNILPNSLKESLAWFLCAAAALRLNGYQKPISMLVHTSQKQVHHDEISEAIRNWLIYIDKDELLEMCEWVWKEETEELTKESFAQSYPSYGRLNSINEYPVFCDLIEGIRVLVREITNIPMDQEGQLSYGSHLHLCVDNCSKNGVNEEGMVVRLVYPDAAIEPYPSPAPVFIVIGGSTLSRGLTIEGLVSTYFLRSTCQGDSLMQMGRWFGYRRGYELLPRIWMTEDTISKFKFLAALEVELREDLVRFMHFGAKPTEYGPRVKNTPKAAWLKITAKNKMQSAVETDLDYTGTNPQTILFENDYDILHSNIIATEEFLKKLMTPEISHDNTAFVWRDIRFETVISEYLDKYKFHERASVFNDLHTFSEWVKKLTNEGELKNWNVIVAGNEIKENTVSELIWNFGAGQVGKINRSRKVLKNTSNNIINIGVLRAPKDLLADIKLDKLSAESITRISKTITKEDVGKIRSESGLGSVPQLIIYRINKNAHAGENNKQRKDLEAIEDIIGLCFILPGASKKNRLARTLTIKLAEDLSNEIWDEEE